MTRTSEDPDGLDCYSDHESDIAYCGECSMCGSPDPALVGHVLPAVERKQGLNPVEAAELVMSDQTMRMFDGILLDLFTASYIVAVNEALGEPARAKLRSMSLPVAANTCFKLVAARS